jgi:diaminohydroxyphosphoribosylaminopyrimidine deaminase/5-amino-6-(5-phosphoribosylamino)uracil reductase
MKDDVYYMQRALTLAAKAKDTVGINPMVGAIYVKDGNILAEGYHHGFGKVHAEYDALINPAINIEGSTVYVNLEPCGHDDLYTACASLLIEKKVKRVVIASLDPNPIEDGDGVERLKAAGIAVTLGVLDKDNRRLNAHYLKRFGS